MNPFGTFENLFPKPQHSPRVRQEWDAKLADRYISGWPEMRSAVEGLIGISCDQAEQVLRVLRHRRDSKCPDWLTWNELNLNYKRCLLGPLLGVVTLSSFAVEAFTRLVTVCCLRKAHAGAGIDKELRTIDELDAFRKRLDEAARLANVKLDGDFASSVVELMGKRNQYAHDEPRFMAQCGIAHQFSRRKKGTRYAAPREKFYPLGDRSMPITFSDSLWSARVQTTWFADFCLE